MASPGPAPKSPEQSEKNKKYDRQLRLWGDHGQFALESAQVCLINATTLGTEIIKSLVLPGVGAFTIVDGKKTTMDDIGSKYQFETNSVLGYFDRHEKVIGLSLDFSKSFDMVDHQILLEKLNCYGIRGTPLNWLPAPSPSQLATSSTVLLVASCEGGRASKILLVKSLHVFFLEMDSLGKSRAQVTTQLLLELNAAVRGDYVDENIEQLLENSPDFFNSFTVVVATALPERVLIPLSKKLWNLDIPFLVCRSYGFIGYLRVQVAEHTVIETHPDNQTPDLRLDTPFPSLRKHVDSIDLDSMEYKEHAHVPYLVILYKYLQKYRNEHGRDLPKTYKEKECLRQIIRNGILKDEHGNPEDEENFEEAIKAVNATITPTKIPSSVQKILDDDCCINLTSKSKPFWIMAKAVRDFVENEGMGLLPLRGSVPDMTANTESYISLLQLYHNQANKEVEIVFRRVQQLLHQLNQLPDTISESDVKLFCKHAFSVYLVRGTSIADEYDFKSLLSQNIALNLEHPDTAMVYYVMLRAVDRFYAEYNTYPGEFDDQVEPDIVKLKSLVCKLLSEWSCGPLAKDDYVHEVCRYGAAEIHSVSAFMGGCISQEIIKFITRQYVPVNNTFIYDAISSTTTTFTF